MAPLIVLVVVTLLARAAGALGLHALRSGAAAVRIGLAVMFCFTAAAHFNAMRGDMVRMVPPWMPAPELMVTITGIAEILGAIGLLIPATRVAAAAGLVLLLIAVLPANIHAAVADVPLGGRPPTPLFPRILLQLLFIAAVWWAGISRAHQRREVAAV